MARGLGCIEYVDGRRRYFVHCETSGGAFSTLFDSPAEAQATYRAVGVDGLSKRRGQSRQVEVVKFSRVSGWDDACEFNWQFEQYGLATQDAFLEPLSDTWGRRRSLQVIDGLMHVAEDYEGGFSGDYEVALCELRKDNGATAYNPSAQVHAFEDWFGKPLGLCPDCTDALIA